MPVFYMVLCGWDSGGRERERVARAGLRQPRTAATGDDLSMRYMIKMCRLHIRLKMSGLCPCVM